jgi:hypothetical protein
MNEKASKEAFSYQVQKNTISMRKALGWIY